MARPSVPLIRPDEAIRIALSIIDRNGIDGFSMRILAAELNVNAASLYYHFANKDEILHAVANRVLYEHSHPRVVRGSPWQSQMTEMLVGTLDALLLHPNILPILVRRGERAFAKRTYEYLTGLLIDAGVPRDVVLPLLEAHEALLIGIAMLESHASSAVAFDVDDERYPVLASVMGESDMDLRRLAKVASHALVNGWVEASALLD